MIIDSPTVPSHNGLSSIVSFDGFQQVDNKKKKKTKYKLTTSTIKKKRTYYQTNIISKSAAPSPLSSISASVAAEPLPHKVPCGQQVQNVQQLQDIQQVSGGPQVQGALSLSHPQQISITTESSHYAQTRYPFLPFSIRFNTGNATSNQIKEGLTTYYNQKYQMEINILNCLSGRSNMY
ncbi:unnamed protein product [Rotaria sordida]|uniref:Uncharacterized protein n=1 Tax=Rotaria sordida TaxID=392033 RepID=A0A820H9C2_9BILA|nr:unnamed protein product [Rotaria sordida]